MLARFRIRPNHATVVSYLALFIALGSGAYAATQLPKNSVGTKQLKNGAVTGKKIRHGSITGADVKAGTLGTVPFARRAGSAAPTGPAGGDLTGSYPTPTLAASEAFHVVGKPGEPVFQHSWQSAGYVQAAFYKDREGVVHLQGDVLGGTANTTMFQLPPGYRPPSGEIQDFAAACDCGFVDSKGDTGSVSAGDVRIDGLGFNPLTDGAVSLYAGTAGVNHVHLDGITFRAGS